ncbi:MAG: hypothetical protein JO101_01085 [Candidatus Eremiobacteraeota bacterium]|nr:hypothetical protein [Candidatus Eremiobacteraeota bacterium]MBV8353885.1 hypothetical protein [Candidatus Eremiobacteraeota bacterium]
MLAKIKCPPLLEGDPLARRLRDALGAESPSDAAQRVVDRALEREHPRLREVVRRCDFEGRKVLAVALDLNLSTRQVFRYRGAAVDAIARTVGTVLNVHSNDPAAFQLCPRCLREMS